MNNPTTLFDFNIANSHSKWRIVDDVVMGGSSSGQLTMSTDGHGMFSGSISTENNGGFSSVRYQPDQIDSKGFKKFIIRIKGDGKKYQFRAQSILNDFYSYVTFMHTTNDWQIIEIPFKGMYPYFRGYRLERPNFKGDKLTEIGFLIGSDRNEDYKLEIDWIKME